jgi:hypothetical protein
MSLKRAIKKVSDALPFHLVIMRFWKRFLERFEKIIILHHFIGFNGFGKRDRMGCLGCGYAYDALIGDYLVFKKLLSHVICNAALLGGIACKYNQQYDCYETVAYSLSYSDQFVNNRPNKICTL